MEGWRKERVEAGSAGGHTPTTTRGATRAITTTSHGDGGAGTIGKRSV